MPHYSLATSIRDLYVTYATTKMCNFFVTNCLENEEGATLDDCWYSACVNNVSEALTQFCCGKYPRVESKILTGFQNASRATSNG